MAVPKSHVFAKGRPSNPHEAVTSVLRYVPRVRTPWQPSTFERRNIMPDDLTSFWNQGRGRTGIAHPDSGYFTGKSSTLEEQTINLIPKAELEKYMPDIWLGPKALVTPVSMMNVRAGHRVTHDMLHSYDKYIGSNDKLATVDHDNITPQDPNRVGLHPATIHCRGRIYRWLRRGPFFQEDNYFRRNVAPDNDPELAVTPEEVRLAKKVIRIANKGHLKAAAEEYRKFVSVPPVQVYRALTAACIGQGKIGDAVAIFEDGNSKLFYVSRDPEVLINLMKTAIAARNRSRVLWVYNVARGRFYENSLARAEIDTLTLYEISRLALEYFADRGCVEEARTVYDFLSGEESVHQQNYASAATKKYFATSDDKRMTEYDLYKAAGLRLREALAKGEKIPAYTSNLGAELAASKNVDRVAVIVQKVLAERDAAAGNTTADNSLKPNETAVQFLGRRYRDLDVAFVLRHARYMHNGKTDLLSASKGEGNANISEEQLRSYANRTLDWLTVLSRSNAKQTEDIVMPYLFKSKPSAINPNLRVAYLPETLQRTRLLANESGYKFHYGVRDRFVSESYAQAGTSLASQVLALQPNHSPISATADFSPKGFGLLAGGRKRPTAERLLSYDATALAERRRNKQLHPSLTQMHQSRNDMTAGVTTASTGNTVFSPINTANRSGGVDVAAAKARVNVVTPVDDSSFH